MAFIFISETALSRLVLVSGQKKHGAVVQKKLGNRSFLPFPLNTKIQGTPDLPGCPEMTNRIMLYDPVFAGALVRFFFRMHVYGSILSHSQKNGRRDINGRKRPYHDPDKHGQGKVIDHPASQ